MVPALRLLSPHGHSASGGPEPRDVAGLVLLAAGALALADLGGRRAFLELLDATTRLAVELVVLATAPLLALALCVAGAGGTGPHGATWLAPAALAALHLAGIGLALGGVAESTALRVALFLALSWWAPALLLDAGGWQGWARDAVAPALSLAPRPSDSPGTGAILPRALLAGAAILAGALTARGTLRIA